MLDKNLLKRGAFAWERNDCASRAACHRVLSEQASRKISEHELDRVLGILNAVPLASSGKVEAWIDRLDEIPDAWSSSETTSTKTAYEGAVAPFVSLALDQIVERHRDLFAANGLPKCGSRVARWYRNRLLSISKYALHIAWVSSGVGYATWIIHFAQAPSTAWKKIFAEFPVLARHLHAVETRTYAALDETLTRFSTDRELFYALVSKMGMLADLEPGLSDPHNGGRTVTRLHFVDGSTIIYKPKPLDIDASIQELARAGDQVGEGLVPLQIIPRSGFGWMEDAAPLRRAKASPEATGRVAALFWLLNATDLHAENLIGRAEGFLALDLETLFAAPLAEIPGAPDPSWQTHTLLTTQLVQISKGISRRPNISGFFPDNNLGLLAPSIQFKLVGDRVEIVKEAADRRTDSEISKDVYWNPTEIERLVAAFTDHVGRSRHALANVVAALPNGIVTRIVLRDTVFYEGIMARMAQPRFLRDGLELSLDLLRLIGSQLALPPLTSRPDFQPHGEAIALDEISQLLAGDIPYFSTRIGDSDVQLSTRDSPATLAQSGKSWALEKLVGLDQSDIAEQASLLRLSLGSNPWRTKILDSFADLSVLLSIAAHDLADSAFQGAERPSRWIGMTGDVRHDELHVSCGQRNLFSGSWGILAAIEAATCASCDGPRVFLEREAQVWEKLTRDPAGCRGAFFASSLGFEGIGGLAFAVGLLARISPQRWAFLVPRLQHAIAIQKSELLAAIAQDRSLDVIAGSAGLLFGLAQLPKVVPTSPLEQEVGHQRTLEELRSAAAHHLVETLTDVGEASSWVTSEIETPNLGYAHGWAGIFTALSTVGDIGSGVISSALTQAASFPLSRYDRDGAWLDYRHEPPTELNRSWCNGAAGLLRGLLALKDWDAEVVEIIAELRHRLEKDLGNSDARRFCCGEMGTLDILADLDRAKGIKFDRRPDAKRILIEAMQNQHAPEALFPSLFQGRAGIIYTAARCVNETIPSLSGQYLFRRMPI